MPEGPELKYFNILLQKITNNKITKIESYNKKNVKNITGKILNVDSKGKLLWLELKDNYIHIHLGLTGWLYIDDEPTHKKYMIQTNEHKIYLDNLATLKILNKEEHLNKINSLGADILSTNFTIDYLILMLSKSKMMIAPFLLKQDKFAGLGNYIKNEALYLSDIHPKMKAYEIDEKKVKKLYEKIKYVAFSVLATFTGKKLKNYPDKLQVPYQFKIYGRDKDIKGNIVKKEKISGRTTYYRTV